MEALLSPQLHLVSGQDKLIVEEDRRPAREEDILSKLHNVVISGTRPFNARYVISNILGVQKKKL